MWQVTGWSSETMTEPMVVLADGLPVVGTADPDDPGMYYSDVAPRSLDPEDTWNVEVTLQENPFHLPPAVNRYATHRTEAVWTDNDGKLPKNKAGDPFNPPLERTRAISRIEVTVRYSMTRWYGLQIENYIDHKNGGAFTFEFTDGNGEPAAPRARTRPGRFIWTMSAIRPLPIRSITSR